MSNNNNSKPDILVILSLIFVVGTAFTSLSVNSEDKQPEDRISQNLIR